MLGLVLVVLVGPLAIRLVSQVFPGGPVTWQSAFLTTVVGYLFLPVIAVSFSTRPELASSLSGWGLFAASLVVLTVLAKWMLRSEPDGGRVSWPKAIGTVTGLHAAAITFDAAIDATIMKGA